jgi:hypothetical protein
VAGYAGHITGGENLKRKKWKGKTKIAAFAGSLNQLIIFYSHDAYS